MSNPVQDVAGDNQLEIVALIYVIGRVKSIDPQTSITRYNLTGFCVIDLMDLNGDGASELFGLQSDQMEPLEWNLISILYSAVMDRLRLYGAKSRPPSKPHPK